MTRSNAFRFGLATVPILFVVLNLASRFKRAEPEQTPSLWAHNKSGGISYVAPSSEFKLNRQLEEQASTVVVTGFHGNKAEESSVSPTSGDAPTAYPSTGVELWDQLPDEHLPAVVDDQVIANYPSTGVGMWDASVELSELKSLPAKATTYDELAGVVIPTHVDVNELVGEYYRGDGTGFNLNLTLENSGDYECVWTGCLGIYGTSQGRWTMTKNKVSLQVTDETGMMEGKSARNLDMLKLKGDLILVDSDDSDFFLRHGPSRYSCFTRRDAVVTLSRQQPGSR